LLNDLQGLDTTLLWQSSTQKVLEIGCGRGAFLTSLARANPSAFCLGVDREAYLVAFTAVRALQENLLNLRTWKSDAIHLSEHLPHNSIDSIYLNFSDPWPHHRHERRRLTHPTYLQQYERLLRSSGTLELKTDNEALFDWSIKQLLATHWTVQEVIRDVPAERPTTEEPSGENHVFPISGLHVQSDFERRFRQEGVSIHYLSATPPHATALASRL
jgi:tRNA (guanine-N7-)-methyltransferase